MSADPAGWPRGIGRIVLDEIDSTMTEAARRAPDYAGPVWIMARLQTAGRGRRGRAWRDGPGGNFAATLLMRPSGGATEAAQHSFIAALALHEALGRLTGRADLLALKWPNDLLLNGGKVSGILLERLAPNPDRANLLAVGVGVNLIDAPAPEQVEPGALLPVSVKGETGCEVTQDALLDQLAAAFSGHLARFEAEGFAPIREAWLARAARLGERVAARTGADTVEGVFEGIDLTGALMIGTATGTRAVPAADVYFPALVS